MFSEVATVNHPRGSLFRRWDIHIHTPASVLENQFGDDWDYYVTSLIRAALANQVTVIGITDYFSIAGYKRLKSEYLENRERLKELLGPTDAKSATELVFIPCVEFRVPPIIEDGEKVDLHVLFSPEVTVQDIEESFLQQLRFRYASGPQVADEVLPLTEGNLRRLGARLKKEHSQFRDRSDLYIGVMNALVDDESISRELSQKPALFRGRYLLGVAADESLNKINWDSGSHQIRKTLIQKSDFLLSASPGTIEFGLGKRHPSVKDYLEEFQCFKPCLWGSDAHDYDRLFRPDEDRYLWIRADTTFEGLRQAIREPRRVSIGSQPTGIQSSQGARASQLIDKILLSTISTPPSKEIWFRDLEIPLNPGLVVIIGNRGSGKSALADAIGLTGATQNADHFSFLSRNSFRKQPENKAQYFQAELLWADGTTSTPICLADQPLPGTPMRVQYVPQLFLERLCADPDGVPFENELDRVMFDLIPKEDRPDANSIAELLATRTQREQSDLRRLQEALGDLNREILTVETDLSRIRNEELRHRRELVRKEILSHYANKPVGEDPGFKRSSDIGMELTALQDKKGEVDSILTELRQKSATLSSHISQLNKLLGELDQLTSGYEALRRGHSKLLRSLELNLDDIIKFEVTTDPVQKAVDALSSQREEISKRLDEDIKGGEANRASVLKGKIDRLRDDLKGPDRVLERNRVLIRAWRDMLGDLIGNKDEPESLEGLNWQLHEHSKLLHLRLARLRERRLLVSMEIHRKKLAIVAAHKAVYQPVLDRIERTHLFSYSELGISVRSRLRPEDAIGELLTYIDRGAAGAFRTIGESETAMHQLVESTNWGSTFSVRDFLESIIEKLEERDPDDPSCISDQMRQNKHLPFYDHLFGLDYIQPMSELTVAGKDLRTLSPGERGAALLIFYLMLDTSRMPLIIDQPEANLDNESVVQWIVELLWHARKKRQIILVTHNPNIAVVADADQVVHATIDRENGNIVSYRAGAIEHPGLNLSTVNILEGTLPAFDNRDLKYEVTRNRSEG